MQCSLTMRRVWAWSTKHLKNAGKHYKALDVTAWKSKTVTLIGCVCGVGKQIPPFFIFAVTRMTSELMEDATPGAVGTVTQLDGQYRNVESYMNNYLIQGSAI